MSDWSGSNLHPILKKLLVGGYNARWKKGEDPKKFGEKIFDHDNLCPFKYAQEKLDYMSCLYLSHSVLEIHEWAKNDLHRVMHDYKESSKNLVRCVIIVLNWCVIIVNKFGMLVLLQ